MYRVALINMPFASLAMPSIALTQLKSVLDQQFAGRVTTEVHYLNHDFAKLWGLKRYDVMADLGSHTGFGDWFFRQAAFDGVADNTDLYVERCSPFRAEYGERLKQLVREKRAALRLFFDSVIERYRLWQADLVGFTAHFSQTVASFALARSLKRRVPHVVTVMGGSNCEWPLGTQIAKNVEQIDYVFSGPALMSLPQFVGHCLAGERERCDEIKGVFSKRNYGKPPAILGEELPIDADVRLDYDPFLRTVERNFPGGEVRPVLLFETSRGCWWGQKAHCTFCGLNGLSMNYRAMSPARAVELFRSLFEYYPRVTVFEGVDNIMPAEYTREVFPALDPPPGATIMYEVKADLTAEELQTLAGARVRLIQPGIEALSTPSLKLMRKGTSAFQNVTFLKNCVTHGIHPAWNLLVGSPGEPEGVYQKYLADIPLLMHLPAPIGVYQILFERYSPYFTRAEQYGLDLRPKDYYELTYPFSAEDLPEMAYFFDDHTPGAEYLAGLKRWFEPLREKVRLWKARWDDAGPHARPSLHFEAEGEETLVYDSRGSGVVKHHVGAAGRALLEALAKPRHPRELSTALEGVSAADAASALDSFRERALVFEEGGRYVSLVLPRRAAPQAES